MKPTVILANHIELLLVSLGCGTPSIAFHDSRRASTEKYPTLTMSGQLKVGKILAYVRVICRYQNG
jgi:hypothetical protein